MTYPNTTLKLTSTSTLTTGILTEANGLYYTVSKLTFAVDDQAIGLQNGLRAVGNSVTCLTYQQSGAGIFGGFPSGWVLYGNYFYNLKGCPTTPCDGCSPPNNQQHVIYITDRHWNTDQTPLAALDIGWNRFENNTERFAIHFYDESDCGEIANGTKVHDNWILNQDGTGIGFTGGGCFAAGTSPNGGPSLGYFSVGTVSVYNNVQISTGLNLSGCSVNYQSAMGLMGSTLQGTVNFYDNTIYSYDQSSTYTSCLKDSTQESGSTGTGFCAALLNNTATNVTFTWVNNLVFDVAGFNYTYIYEGANPSTHSSNLYYSSKTPTMATPSWDTSPVNSNPLFTNASSYNFSLQSGSPALGAGANFTTSPPSGLVAERYDIAGDIRPVPQSIGAFDDPANSNPALPPPPAAPWIILQ